MPRPLASRGKVLPFAAPRIVSGVSPGVIIEGLIANNLQLLQVLGRVCEFYGHAAEGEPLSCEASIVEDLRAAFAEANRLHDILDHNTLGIQV